LSIIKYFNLCKNKLFPIYRSITGKGIEKTLKIIKTEFPKLKIYKIKSGEKIFDWKIPMQWDINDAYIIDKNKKKIINFKKNNLHIVGYSHPVNKNIKLNNLLKRINTLPKQPRAIPYCTSYYKKYWGFCITDKQKNKIKKEYNKNDKFKVVVRSKFKKGYLKYGELLIKGKSKQEILISTYVCHPSMANNELSGPIVSMSLINFFLKKKKLAKTLRFIFIPETIGSIAYINKNLDYLKSNLIGGYNLSCIGDNRMHSCMLTKYKNSPSDFSLLEAYKKLKIKFKIYSFLKRGSDERQYNSPGIDLPIASIFRSKYGEYPEYHTSLDDFNLVTKEGIKGGFAVAKTAIEILLNNIIPKNRILCEPNMGKRKLYPTLSSNKIDQLTKDIMNFLTYADGKNGLKTIAKYIKKNYSETKKIYNILKIKNLIT
jgi:aminopeptidase-like protein